MAAINKVNEQVVLVTGAGHGIGLGIAERLLAEGHRVVLADIDRTAVEAAARAAPSRALAVEADVSREESVTDMIRQSLDHFGRITALINNAGIANPDSGPVEALSLDDWNRVIATNLTGCFLCSKMVTPALRDSGHGNIINIASTRALQSEPGSEAYAASKGGIVALTHALAISLGPAIRVNCISPGWIATRESGNPDAIAHRQHPVGRVGTPADVAGMVLYLLSADADFITGQNLIVDGGMTRKMIYLD